jgi:hypothetical protein
MTRPQEVYLGRIRDQDRAAFARLENGLWVPTSPLIGTYDGDPAAIWNFGPGGPPHGGFWGTTGGGKSSGIRMVTRGLVRRSGPRAITIIDAEGAGEYTVMRRMPGIAEIINVNPTADRLLPEGEPTSVERAAQAIKAHLTLATERQLELDKASAAWEAHLVDPAHHQPPRYVPPAEAFLIIDGWATLCYNLNRYLPRGQRMDPVEDAIWIGRNGRKTDVHLLLADQVSYAKRSKDDAGIPSELKKQLGLRVAAVGPLGITASEAAMIFDEPVTPPKELGGCLMKVGATLVPFVVPAWSNPTDPRSGLSSVERREAFRLLPSPEAA